MWLCLSVSNKMTYCFLGFWKLFLTVPLQPGCSSHLQVASFRRPSTSRGILLHRATLSPWCQSELVAQWRRYGLSQKNAFQQQKKSKLGPPHLS